MVNSVTELHTVFFVFFFPRSRGPHQVSKEIYTIHMEVHHSNHENNSKPNLGDTAKMKNKMRPMYQTQGNPGGFH